MSFVFVRWAQFTPTDLKKTVHFFQKPQLCHGTSACICYLLLSGIKFLDSASFPGGYSPLCFHSVIANWNLRILTIND